MCLMHIKQFLVMIIDIGTAATDITIKSDRPEPFFHILKTAACIDKQKISIGARLADCKNSTLRNGTVPL